MLDKINNVNLEDVVDVTSDANFIWSIANKLRGTYMPDKYADVIIPMTIIRRFECVLKDSKDDVLAYVQAHPTAPESVLCRKAGYQFYNISKFSLAELCNDPDHIKSNFKAYIDSFSKNVIDIMNALKVKEHIDTMDEGGCLFTVVKAFSELDLSPKTVDSVRMGYIFENLIGRFFQNVDAGQYYTGRDIIKTLVSILLSEGCDDIFEDHKVVTILDQACGTGGMLSTAYTFIKQLNETADIYLYGQEFMPVSHAVGLAEMLIKGQNADHFMRADTFKTDCFKDTKMRFVIENPPFGTPWGGDQAKEGQEDAVKKEYEKGENSRWPAGLPGKGDGQLLFVQSAIDKLDPKTGRAAIIENGSPLFTGGTSSGESQIRRCLIENDYLEAIIALPTDLFYNTGIQTYAWIISMNKRPERKGKVQLIDASTFYKKLRKPLGNKKNELSAENRKQITKLYTDFCENEYCKIYDFREFMYKEYTVMQPLQKSYAITDERIENMLSNDTLKSLYDEAKVFELENKGKLTDKEKKNLEKLAANKPVYDAIVEALKNNVSDAVYMSPAQFSPVIRDVLKDFDKKLVDKVAEGLGAMDKNAEIQTDKKGNILYDKDTKDTELVPYLMDIDEYMAKEVLPHVPDAKAFFEEDLTAKTPKIKTGAEIPFTRYFYKYQQPRSSEEILAEFKQLEDNVQAILSEVIK